MIGIPWNLIAARLQGDLGGVTCYTDTKFRKVVFPISPPDKPASPAQAARRSRFKAAQQAWSQLSAAEKEALEVACRLTCSPLTGQNLYISVALSGDEFRADTLARQSGVSLPPIPHVA